YQFQVLQALRPDVMEKLAAQADDLGTHLGDDHDLAVLTEKLRADTGPVPDRAAAEKLTPFIEGRRTELQEQAWDLGHQLYEEKPKRFADRLKGYWHAWRCDAAAKPKEEPHDGREQPSETPVAT